MLAHAGLAVVFGIEMILARAALEDLAGGSNLNALTERAVGFMEFRHIYFLHPTPYFLIFLKHDDPAVRPALRFTLDKDGDG